MNYEITILNTKTIQELPNAWSTEDMVKLLEEFGFDESPSTPESELRDLLYMAISDSEPDEAAKIILTYVLHDKLTEGQIDQISHEMQDDAVYEEYADISLHKVLFRINQLLYKAYNGRFPNGKATVIDVSLKPKNHQAIELSEQTILAAVCAACSERNIITRLFEKQLAGKVEFPEAESILWQIDEINETTYKLITSEYWISEEDIVISKLVANIPEFDEAVDV